MLIRRLILLYSGLALYGLSTAMMVRADLGLDPWNVLHQGIATKTGLSLGAVIIVVGLLLLLLWIPLRQRPGVGTISNVLLVGVAADAALAAIPTPGALPIRTLFLVAAVALNGLATGMYVGAGLGPGPRDGLMTGLSARMGWSIRRSRAGIELSVLAAGWLLGGTIGVGTVLYALAIGPLIQLALPLCRRWCADGVVGALPEAVRATATRPPADGSAA